MRNRLVPRQADASRNIFGRRDNQAGAVVHLTINITDAVQPKERRSPGFDYCFLSRVGSHHGSLLDSGSWIGKNDVGCLGFSNLQSTIENLTYPVSVFASALASFRISKGTSFMLTLNSNMGISVPRPQRLTSQWARTNFVSGCCVRSSKSGCCPA